MLMLTEMVQVAEQERLRRLAEVERYRRARGDVRDRRGPGWTTRVFARIARRSAPPAPPAPITLPVRGNDERQSRPAA